MSFANNNNNNNNNNGHCNNCYVVPVPVITLAPSQPAGAGNRSQLVHVATNEATCHEQDRQMAACIACAALQPGFICHAASANAAPSSSSGANNGSKSSRLAPCYTSHICCSTVTPLPTADKMRRYSSMNILDHQNIIAQESADFRSALKAGGFPLLVPGHFLKTAQDLRNNASPSYISKATKGVKPGTKILPRHKTSPLPSWHETWMKAEDWPPVPKGQEDVLQWGLGAGFRVQYRHPLEVVVDVDEMASSHGAFGSMQME